MAHDLILSRTKLGTFMLVTYPDIYAAQRHNACALYGTILEVDEICLYRDFGRSTWKNIGGPAGSFGYASGNCLRLSSVTREHSNLLESQQCQT